MNREGVSHRYPKGTLFRRPSLRRCVCARRVLDPADWDPGFQEWVCSKHLTRAAEDANDM